MKTITLKKGDKIFWYYDGCETDGYVWYYEEILELRDGNIKDKLVVPIDKNNIVQLTKDDYEWQLNTKTINKISNNQHRLEGTVELKGIKIIALNPSKKELARLLISFNL